MCNTQYPNEGELKLTSQDSLKQTQLKQKPNE